MEIDDITGKCIAIAKLKPFKMIHPQLYYNKKFHLAIFASRDIIVELFLARKMVSVECLGSSNNIFIYLFTYILF